MKMINSMFLFASLSFASVSAIADNYIVDIKGMHAAIQFKISHLGYSWLVGRFNNFDGSFNYDKNKPEDSKIEIIIKTNSIDTNHAKRDKHLREEDFLDVDKYPEAKFTSTSFSEKSDGTAVLKGNFTLHGITKPISIDVKYIGQGNDPWGGYRIGFEGETRISLADYGLTYDLGPASTEMDLFFHIEGIKI